jgi:hypothetical protein
MIAQDFIEENRFLLDDKQKESRYTDLELLAYLQGAYATLQKDAPQFRKTITFDTEENKHEYHINYEVIDGISLKVAGKKYNKVTPDAYYLDDGDEWDTGIYTLEHNYLHINKLPRVPSQVVFVFYRIKELVGLDTDIVLPISLKESLRLLFLSRAFEKMPSKNDRDLSIHYYKRYQVELTSAMKRAKQKQSGLRSSHQKV